MSRCILESSHRPESVVDGGTEAVSGLSAIVGLVADRPLSVSFGSKQTRVIWIGRERSTKAFKTVKNLNGFTKKLPDMSLVGSCGVVE